MVTKQEILNCLNTANANERIWKGSIESHNNRGISLRDSHDGNVYNLVKSANSLHQSLRRRGNVIYLWTSEQRNGSLVLEGNYNGARYYWTLFPQEEFLNYFPNFHDPIVGSFLDKERLYSILDNQSQEIAVLRREVQQISHFSSQVQLQLEEIKKLVVSLSSDKDKEIEQGLANLQIQEAQIQIPPKK